MFQKKVKCKNAVSKGWCKESSFIADYRKQSEMFGFDLTNMVQRNLYLMGDAHHFNEIASLICMIWTIENKISEIKSQIQRFYLIT